MARSKDLRLQALQALVEGEKRQVCFYCTGRRSGDGATVCERTQKLLLPPFAALHSNSMPAPLSSMPPRISLGEPSNFVQCAEVLRTGVVSPGQMEPLLAHHKEADARIRAAEAKLALRTALTRFTDPALLRPWCSSLAGKLQGEVEDDWHDGYEEQSACFGEVMVDFETMIAVASMACCELKEYSRALTACEAIGSGQC